MPDLLAFVQVKACFTRKNDFVKELKTPKPYQPKKDKGNPEEAIEKVKPKKTKDP